MTRSEGEIHSMTRLESRSGVPDAQPQANSPSRAGIVRLALKKMAGSRKTTALRSSKQLRQGDVDCFLRLRHGDGSACLDGHFNEPNPRGLERH
jgi:hypothetical protein